MEKFFESVMGQIDGKILQTVLEYDTLNGSDPCSPAGNAPAGPFPLVKAGPGRKEEEEHAHPE